MTEQGTTAIELTRDNIRAWLVARVAHYLDEPPEAIDAETPLGRYGLDSVYAFALSGEIEEVLGVAVEPTLIWEVEDLAELTDRILEVAAGPPSR
jgi:acyl carrier protein